MRAHRAVDAALILSCLVARADAQSPPPLRTIAFDTNEGTFMCVDVSPDGRTLLFDLLGDLYTMPIEGGKAKPLLAGRAWDRCPRYSPDGKHVAFISDRAGLENIWTLALATRHLEQLTDIPLPDIDLTGATGMPVWLPGGRELVYRTSKLSRAQLTVTTVAGSDAPTRRASRPLIPMWQVVEGQPAIGASSPSFTPDGRTAYFAAITAPPRQSAEGSERKSATASVYRYTLGGDAPSRLREPVTGRDEFKPLVSNSGRLLAYGRSDGVRNQELRVLDLQTGDDRRLIALTDVDDVVAGADYVGDEIPGYAFTPDDRFIVIWNGGRLQKVAMADGATTVIPMAVRVVREVATPIRAHHRILDGPLSVRALRWPTLSPNRKTLVFSAVGSLWVVDLAGGRGGTTSKPRRLTASDDFELMPAFSPDGKELAYVAFAHDDAITYPPGRLMIRRMDSGATRVAMNDSASYWFPSWSSDGTKIAVVREVGVGRFAPTHYGYVDLASPAFTQVAAAEKLASGNQRYITPHNVVFSRDGNSLIYTDGPDSVWHISLKSARLDGTGVRELLSGESDVVGFFPSPDLTKTVVLGWDYRAYLAALPPAGAPSVHVSVKAGPDRARLTPISDGGALYPRWLDASSVLYGWTTSLYTYRAGDARGARVAQVALEVPRRGGRGTVAFRGARLITMSGTRGAGRVIERGTIVVRERRITAIGPTDSVAIPAGASVVDVAGMTIMPGIVDSHSHGLEGISLPAIPLATPDRTLYSGLAYGVTSDWEATGRTSDDASLARIELIESGRVRAGRWSAAIGRFTLLEPHGAPYTSYEEVRSQVLRKKELGGEQCVKNYFGKYRTVAQWIAAAVREAGICVVGHVGNPPQLLSRVADGYSMDHPAMWAPAYRDVVEYIARAGAIWTPHDNFARAATRPGYARAMFEELRARDVDGRELRKFERYGGRDIIARWQAAPLMSWEESNNGRVAKVAASIVAAGGKIAASTDGTSLLENHFQMWSLHRGGMAAADVLRSATMTPAEKIGVNADVGSLAIGKLADFLVLTANPLERIENTLALKYTVLGGVIYDSETLQVIRP